MEVATASRVTRLHWTHVPGAPPGSSLLSLPWLLPTRITPRAPYWSPDSQSPPSHRIPKPEHSACSTNHILLFPSVKASPSPKGPEGEVSQPLTSIKLPSMTRSSPRPHLTKVDLRNPDNELGQSGGLARLLQASGCVLIWGKALPRLLWPPGHLLIFEPQHARKPVLSPWWNGQAPPCSVLTPAWDPLARWASSAHTRVTVHVWGGVPWRSVLCFIP